MRASKRGIRGKAEGRGRKKPSRGSKATPQSLTPVVHISGAEGMYPKKEIPAIIQEYITRAQSHPKGKPDSIVISIEKIRQKPKPIIALPITTVKCRSTSQAISIIPRLLATSGISEKAITTALSVLKNNETMRGAALVLSGPGRRVEPDRLRGVRASRMGISKTAEQTLSSALKKEAIDTQTVREAVILASKVASCNNVVAELCISDNPDYTTGYVASTLLGYVRVPHIKKKGDRHGGRVFFLSDKDSLPSVMSYLEETAVIIAGVSDCYGTRSVDEIIDRHNM